MDNHINEAVGDNDPLSTTSAVFAESDTVAAGRCVINQILGDKLIEWLTLKSWDILCGQDRETDDENLGHSGFTNQRRVDPVNPEDIKGSSDKNLPQVTDGRVYLKPIQFSPSTFFICFLTEKKKKL